MTTGIRHGLTTGLLLALLWGAGGALAADTPGTEAVPFTITADSAEFDSNRSIYTARGNVRIHKGQQTLTADWVMFSSETRHGLASGNVVHVDGPDRLTGDFLQFNIDSLKGFVRRAVLTSDESKFVMEGSEVRKTGEETYEFQEAGFTTCNCPDDGRLPWKIKADEANLEFDGYGTARNTTFEVLGVPVLWLPWAAYPLKRERSSGFLLPEVNSTNRGGMDFGLPFLWAARHNLNVILTPQYLEKRGFKGSAEFEWALANGSRGDFWFTGLDDGEVEDGDPQQPFHSERGAITSQQDWRLPLGVRGKVDARLIRDNFFVRDFQDLRRHRTDRYLESVGFLSKNFFAAGWLHGTAAAHWADDLQNPDNLDRDQFMVQRLPNLSMQVLSKPVFSAGPANLVASLDTDYSYFYSRENASDEYPGLVVGDDVFVDTGFDGVPSSEEVNSAGRVPPGGDQHQDDLGPEGDGRFQEGELIGDRGHRVLMHPRLSVPFRIADIVEVVPEIGYQQTFYETDAQSGEDRGLITARLDMSTRLRRKLAPGWVARPVTHMVEPFLSWGFVQSTSQRDNPLFIPGTATPQERIRMLDVDNVTRDSADRIDRFNGFTVGVRNQLVGRSLKTFTDPETGEETYSANVSRLVADVTLAFNYEIAGNRLGNVVLGGHWWPWTDWNFKFHLNYDVGDTDLDEVLLRFGYWSREGHNLNIQYRYVNDIPAFFEEFKSDKDRLDDFESGFDRVNQIWIKARWAVTTQWALTYQLAYAFEESLFMGNRAGVEYISGCGCWAVRAVANFRRDSGLDLGLRLTLLGLGDDSVRPFSGAGRGGWLR